MDTYRWPYALVLAGPLSQGEQPLPFQLAPAIFSSIALLGLSDFDLWVFCYKFLGYEGDPHAPTGMDTK